MLASGAGIACVLLLAVAALALCMLFTDASTPKATSPSERSTDIGSAAMTSTPAVAVATTGVRATAVAVEDDGSPPALSTRQLCRQLSSSYPPVGDNSTIPAQWTQVQLREHLLNEIERRDPIGFNRWLATVPQPGSDPSEHLTHG